MTSRKTLAVSKFTCPAVGQSRRKFTRLEDESFVNKGVKNDNRHSADSGLNFTEYRDTASFLEGEGTNSCSDSGSETVGSPSSSLGNPDGEGVVLEGRENLNDTAVGGKIVRSFELGVGHLDRSVAHLTGELDSLLDEIKDKSLNLFQPSELEKGSSSSQDATTLLFATEHSTLGNHSEGDGRTRESVTLVDSITATEGLADNDGSPRLAAEEIDLEEDDSQQYTDDMSKIREPSIFHGTPEEDAQDWLDRFEEIVEVNNWKTKRLTYVKLYLEGSARKWFLVANPQTWEELQTGFLDAFKHAHFQMRVEARLRSRQQGLNEPVTDYFYDIMDLCQQLEEDLDEDMAEEKKVQHLLRGLTPKLLGKLWPLVPDPIKNSTQFLALATKYSEAEYLTKNRDWAAVRERPVSINSLPSQLQNRKGSVSREEFEFELEKKQNNHFQQVVRSLQRELSEARLEATTSNYQPPRRAISGNQQPRTMIREFSTTNVPGRNFVPNTTTPRTYQVNRTSDGRPICHNCRKPGHIARFCNSNRPAQLNSLHTTGDRLVTEDVLCNGIEAKALIDTGAAITAVSDKFAQSLKDNFRDWNGPSISLANGQRLYPRTGVKITISLDNKRAQGVAIVKPLTNSDILLGNDFLREFGSLNIQYLQDKSPNLEQWSFDTDIPTEGKQNDIRVFMAKDRQIPAQAMALVEVVIKYGIQNPTLKAWIVEPSTNLFTKKGVSLGHSIITNLNEVYLTNLSKQGQYIPKGTCLAKLEAIYETNSLCVNNMTELPMDETINPEDLRDKLNARINQNLEIEERRKLCNLLYRHRDCFAENKRDLGHCEILQHQIITNDAKPIHQLPYPSAFKQRELIQAQVSEMLSDGVIEPSCSPWSSPVILVKKKDGT